jgi:hypothetical protein
MSTQVVPPFRNFGVIAPGDTSDSQITIPQVPSDAPVTAVITNDTSGGLFGVTRLEAFDVDYGARGRIRDLTKTGESGGVNPLEVSAGQLLKVSIRFRLPDPPPLTFSFSALLTIGGRTSPFPGTSHWFVRVPLIAGIGQIATALLEGSITLQQGTSHDLPILITSMAGPDTFVRYALAQTPGADGITLTHPQVSVPAGTTVPSHLHFEADIAASVGEHTVNLFEYAFGDQQADLLDHTVIINVTPTSIPSPDRRLVRFVERTTKRVCQLTGGQDAGYNNEVKPHVNNTTAFDLIGTDLGTSFDHMVDGERRTYLFFGDTHANDADSSGDAIAYTTDNDPEPDGLHLRFITGDNNWRRLVIPGVSLGYFEVPSGGFSHAGRLFVFATTDHFSERGPDKKLTDYMGRSVLASARDAGENFERHYDVSNCNTTCRFINVSPWKVNNDDWPGLPDNAWSSHQGLLMMGSGRYRESDPYLAYVPLVDLDVPSRERWRYFRGLDPHNQPVWTDQEFQAAPVFFDNVFGELSFVWNPFLRRWLLLYASPPGIWMRSSEQPWGPWTAPQLLFEGGGGVYAPYVISRYNRYNPASGEATLYFTMSVWELYQVMLMKSTLRLA